MKRKSFLSYLIVFFATLTLTVACNNPATNTGGSGETSLVRLGFSAWPGWFPWQVTYEQGIFEQNNANVDLKWFDGYLESINTLTAQQIDANSQTLGDTVSSIAGGADQVIVLVNDNSTGNDKIIVSEDINTIQDLRGKKVAAEEGTVDHFLLLLGMKEAGLAPEDIEFVPLETGSAAAAFVAGQVDAVAVFAPFTTQALNRPDSKELFSSRDFPGSISDHLVFTRQFVENNPDEVQNIVNSWFATMDYIQENPDQANEIMAQRAGVSVDEYAEYAEGTRLFTVEENLEAFTLGDDMTSLYYSAQQMNEFLVDVGLANQEADISNIFDDRFVRAYAEKKG